MIKFLLFPHSLHKRLSNLLNCICMLIEMNQLSGLCGAAAAYGHLLLWSCLMPWGQQKALVATGLHPAPQSTSSLQAMAMPLLQGRQEASWLSWPPCWWGSFPWKAHQERWYGKGREWPDWGSLFPRWADGGQELVRLWMCFVADPSVPLRFSGCLKAVPSAEDILPLPGRMVSSRRPTTRLAAPIVAQWWTTHGRKVFSSWRNRKCPLWAFASPVDARTCASSLQPFLMLISPANVIHTAAFTSPVQANLYSVLLQLSEVSKCLRMGRKPQQGCLCRSVARLHFLGARDSILELSGSLWKLPRAWQLCLWIR